MFAYLPTRKSFRTEHILENFDINVFIKINI
jgi:hypothetical protein